MPRASRGSWKSAGRTGSCKTKGWRARTCRRSHLHQDSRRKPLPLARLQCQRLTLLPRLRHPRFLHPHPTLRRRPRPEPPSQRQEPSCLWLGINFFSSRQWGEIFFSIFFFLKKTKKGGKREASAGIGCADKGLWGGKR